MKYFFKIFLVSISFPFFIFSQKFKISNISSEQYSIDRIAQGIYFKDFYSDTVRMVNLKNMEVNKTTFTYLPPIFSNKQHFMVYRNTLSDLDKQLSYEFDISEADSFGYMVNAGFPGSFSPSDSIFIYGNPKYYVPITEIPLKPINSGLNVFNSVNYDVNDAYPQWSSDSSFVFLSLHNDAILEYFLKSKKLDTLVIADTLKNNTFLGFAYNIKYNILAYSTPPDTSQIIFQYTNLICDSLIFSPYRDDIENIS